MLPMKPIAGAPDKSAAKPGMAFFADTGPPHTTCGTCAHRGYYKKAYRYDRDIEDYVETRRKTHGCMMYRKLSGEDGPPVDADWRSCKYYEPVKDGSDGR